MISIILYGRNDSHGYNLHKRAALSINCIAEVLTHPNDEIIFVDCNTPDDMPTFLEAIRDTLTPRARQLTRVLRLRPTLFEKYKRGTHLKVLEPLSRNIAIRRTNPKNRWILSTNTDMVFVSRVPGKSLSDIVADTPDGFYELPRFEVPETLWETLDRTDPTAIIDSFTRWGQRLHINEVIIGHPVVRYDGPGDFQLMLREQLYAIHGFDEAMVLGWHVDSNLCKRLYLLNGITDTLVDKLFAYHCDHTRQSTIAHGADRVENSLLRFFERVDSPYLLEQALTWGLPHEKIEEIRLTDDHAQKFVQTLETMLPGMQVPLIEDEFSHRTFNHGLNYDNQHVLPYISDHITLLPPDVDVGYWGGNVELLRMLGEFRRRYNHTGCILVDKTILEFANPTGFLPLLPECQYAERDGMLERASMYIFDAAMMSFPRASNWGGFSIPEPSDTAVNFGQKLYVAFLNAAKHETERIKHAEPIPRKFVLVGCQNAWFEQATKDIIGTVVTPHSTHVRHGYVRPDAFEKLVSMPAIHTLKVTDHPLDQINYLNQKLNRQITPLELHGAHLRVGVFMDVNRRYDQESFLKIVPAIELNDIDLALMELLAWIDETDGNPESAEKYNKVLVLLNKLYQENQSRSAIAGQTTRRLEGRDESQPLPLPPKPAFGFNVIGYVSGNLGIGVTARNVLRLLIDKGYPVTILDLDPGLGRGQYDLTYNQYAVNSLEQLSNPVNLFVLPPADLVALLRNNPALWQRPGYLNTAWSMWELPVLPPEWIEIMQQLDVLIAESEYIRYAFNFNISNVLTLSAVHPLYLPENIHADRTRFGLAGDAVLFLTSFEPHSDIQRKNPFAVIEAFERSLGSDQRARLVIKLNNPLVAGKPHPLVNALHQRCDGNSNIQIIAETYSYPDVLSLYASCDVFVSLHRAEGLGLGLMEAMLLGKPVIATAWSGNMTFMDHSNSCLVGYRLIPVEGSIAAYDSSRLGPQAVWADPSVDEAAAWMRRLVDEPDLRAAIGRKASLDLARFQEEARRGHFIEELKAIWAQRAYSPVQKAVDTQTVILKQAPEQAAQMDIVIPIYGQPLLLRQCVESVLATTNNAHLILVDDNSPGSDIKALFDTWKEQPRLTLARTKANLGFLGACKAGADLGKAPYILFLNSDTQALEAGWLEKLIPIQDDIAIVGAKLLYPPSTPGPMAGKIQHAGVARDENGVPYHPFLGWNADSPQANQPREVNAITGACFLVRRQIWDELGGWDPRFGRGVYEDVDLCWQARQKSYRVLYQPAACLYHHSCASEAVGGRHLLYGQNKTDNLEKLLTKWQGVKSDEDIFFGKETVQRWRRARKQINQAAELLEKHQFNQALSITQKAVKTAPDLPDVLIGYAQLLAAQGKHRQAAEQMVKALEFAPAHWDARLRLVDEWLAAGMREQAITELAQ
ncbi:MAG: glycosyltransferase, partial [Anaerolineales bacterium]|nr:glycosyltransferase [Anaerolineales bacterium]